MVASFGVGTVLACNASIGSSCSNFYSARVALCGTNDALNSATQSAFLQTCDALGNAPGTGSLATQIDSCVTTSAYYGCSPGTDPSFALCGVRGTLAEGSPCGSDFQCAGGLCFATPSSTSEFTCGVCSSVFLALGTSCSVTKSNDPCDVATGRCIGGVCTAYAHLGESCANIPCDDVTNCDQQTMTCKPFPTKGEACQPTGIPGCQPPDLCVNAVCVAPAQEGAPCPLGNECAPNLECVQPLMTCQTPIVAQSGQPCGSLNGRNVNCETGSTCTNSICVLPKVLGETCISGECATFLFCNGTCEVPDYASCK